MAKLQFNKFYNKLEFSMNRVKWFEELANQAQYQTENRRNI